MTKTLSFEKLYSYGILSFLWILIVVPSSFLASIKVFLLFFSTTFFCLHHYQKRTPLSSRYVFVFIFLILYLYIQLLRGFFETDYSIFGSLKSLSAIGLVVFVTATVTIALNTKMVKYSSLVATICSAIIVYCLAKLLLFVLCILGVLEPRIVLPLLDSIMPGIVFQIFLGDSNLFRLVTSTDMIVCYFTCLALIFGRPSFVSSCKWNLLIFLGVINSVQSMTRFIWIVLAFTFLYKLLSSPRYSGITIVVICLTIVVGPFALANYAPYLEVYNTRSFDIYSLIVKFEQSSKLLDHIAGSPVFGYGAGAYVPGYIRSVELPFQYENQWFALVLQYGLVFVACVWTLIAYRLFRIVAVVTTKRLIAALLFCLFFMSGFTNPNLTILNAALIYILMENFENMFVADDNRNVRLR
jgi:hypothetical protein